LPLEYSTDMWWWLNGEKRFVCWSFT